MATEPTTLTGSSAPEVSVEERVAAVGWLLAEAFRDVLEGIPGSPHRPQQLAHTLGVNVVLTSRLLKAVREVDPIAVTHAMPGPEPLRRVLRATKSSFSKQVDGELLRAAEEAVDRFDKLIRTEGGDRGGLDAIISGWLPDARDKMELLAKQAVYKGMSQLLGVAADAKHYTAVLYPSADGTNIDLLWVRGALGLRRVRPGLVVKFDWWWDLTPHPSGSPLLTLDGMPVETLEDGQGLMLEPFCSSPGPLIKVERVGGSVQFTLMGGGVGQKSALDLAVADIRRSARPLYRDRSEPKRKTGVFVTISIPAKVLIFDVLLHEDVYPGSEPTLGLYRTAFDGVVDPNNPSRDIDRLEVTESIQLLGRGTANLQAKEIPDHVDMIRYACDKLGWDTEKLRGYRCRVEYPVYSSEITMAFEAPLPPQ